MRLAIFFWIMLWCYTLHERLCYFNLAIFFWIMPFFFSFSSSISRSMRSWFILLFSFELCGKCVWRDSLDLVAVYLLFSFELCIYWSRKQRWPHCRHLAIFFWIMRHRLLLRPSGCRTRGLAIFFWIMHCTLYGDGRMKLYEFKSNLLFSFELCLAACPS